MQPPNASRVELERGVWLDAERAVWFAAERLLAVADLHLGYPWVQRTRGQLLPVGTPDDTLDRYAALQAAYQPRRTVVLGDVVHAGLSLPALEVALRDLSRRTAPRSELVLIAGNHDQQLSALLARMGLAVPLVKACRVGPHLLVHGDDGELAEIRDWQGGRDPRGRLVLGHEHPAVTLRDGALRRARCPCFLVAADRLVLPAFSAWASGTDVDQHARLSPLLSGVEWKERVAVIGNKLLRLPATPDEASA